MRFKLRRTVYFFFFITVALFVFLLVTENTRRKTKSCDSVHVVATMRPTPPISCNHTNGVKQVDDNTLHQLSYNQQHISSAVDEQLSLQKVITYLRQYARYSRMSSSDLIAYYTEELKVAKKFKSLMTYDNNDDLKILRTLFPSENQPHTHSEDRIVQQLQVRFNFTRQRTVLLWDSNSDINRYALFRNDCQNKNCKFTNNKDKINSVDAVLFKYLPSHLRRPKHLSHQVWIYYQLESAQNTQKTTKNFINWTATYRSDSVLNTPYEKFSPYVNIDDLPKNASLNYARGKTKLAAWFVSNCGAVNGRMKYVKELQQYAKVDIFGHCGKLKCNRYSTDCFQKLNREYKFYLAFENSNCRDYITEKFFLNALSNDIVPIVMGAHPDDYKKLAPPNSYIHVDEFRSPRELAEYMHILDNNDELYNEYFRWKGTGEFINTKFICRLCNMLQLVPQFTMWYSNLDKWWHSNGTCILPNRNKAELWASWKDYSHNENKSETIVFNF